jgi:large subunit ribosomal protein L12
MEMIYSALLLHSAKQKIDESSVTKVLQAAGFTPDSSKVKAVVAALENVNIEDAISKAAMPVAAAEAKTEKKEEKKEEDIAAKAEQAVEGLAGLFG